MLQSHFPSSTSPFRKTGSCPEYFWSAIKALYHPPKIHFETYVIVVKEWKALLVVHIVSEVTWTVLYLLSTLIWTPISLLLE